MVWFSFCLWLGEEVVKKYNEVNERRKENNCERKTRHHTTPTPSSETRQQDRGPVKKCEKDTRPTSILTTRQKRNRES